MGFAPKSSSLDDCGGKQGGFMGLLQTYLNCMRYRLKCRYLLEKNSYCGCVAITETAFLNIFIKFLDSFGDLSLPL